jgi:hypothetical protein
MHTVTTIGLDIAKPVFSVLCTGFCRTLPSIFESCPSHLDLRKNLRSANRDETRKPNGRSALTSECPFEPKHCPPCPNSVEVNIHRMSKKAIVIAMGIGLVLLFVFAGFVTPSIGRTI